MEEILDDFKEDKNVSEKINRGIIIYAIIQAIIFLGFEFLRPYVPKELPIPSDVPINTIGLFLITMLIFTSSRLALFLYKLDSEKSDFQLILLVSLGVFLGMLIQMFFNLIFILQLSVSEIDFLVAFAVPILIGGLGGLFSYFKIRRLRNKDWGLPLMVLILYMLTFYLISNYTEII